MSSAQRKAGLVMLTAGLSAKGLPLSNNIRRLNHVAGRLLGRLDEFDEDLYYFTMMGTPSTTEPWGFQFQGHHLVINYFVLGDQVVMTPSFWGSEPTIGHHDDGTKIELFADEIEAAVAMLNSLDDGQRSTAVISDDKSGANEQAGAGEDNAAQATSATATAVATGGSGGGGGGASRNHIHSHRPYAQRQRLRIRPAQGAPRRGPFGFAHAHRELTTGRSALAAH
ncbi:MAG: DUF3500 domain-containing protein [Streptosporangiales bacterium]|nr:DUF3500 domain-containing protein [Streptosporangiales bacterium]